MKKKIKLLIGFGIIFSVIYLFHFNNINYAQGYYFFKNVQFGTNIDVLKSHYEPQYNHLIEVKNEKMFIEVAKSYNITQIHSFNLCDRIYWFYFPVNYTTSEFYGFIYYVPYRFW